jgi:hypothetical protein
MRKNGEQQLDIPFGHRVDPTWLRGLLSIARPDSAVVVLAVSATSLWLLGRHFPLGVHVVEHFKVDSVLRGPINFFHALLMIDLVRAANAFIGLITPQSIVELGRSFAALAGGALVIATFILGRLVLPGWIACVAAAATLATPLITVHARYFKEDIFVAPFIVLTLAALIVVLKKPTLKRTIGLGALIGLAAGSKYVGGLLLLPYALVIISCGNRESSRARVMDACIAALTAAGVFVLIELPALFHFNRLLADVGREAHNAMGERTIDGMIYPITMTWGTFHLRHSLWPGLGSILTILCVAGLGAPFLSPVERRRPLSIIAGFALLWYFAHEISPFKPLDSERYMVPLAPLLIVLAAALIYEYVEQWRAGAGTTAAIIVLLVAAIPTAWLSLRINIGASDDPRKLLPEIIANATGSLAVDRFAGNDPMTPFFHNSRDPLPSAADTKIVVTSSLNYERYESWGLLPQQSERAQVVAQFFTRALALPRVDVSNGRPAFGFFNPTTTIIAMDGNPQRLVPIAEMIATTAPSMLVNWKGVPTTPHFLPGKPDGAVRQH